ASELLQRLQARLDFPLQPPTADWQTPAGVERAPAGIYPQARAGLCMVVAGAQLGRLHAEQLLALAELSERHAGGELRLTPWQGLLLGNVPQAEAATLSNALGELGLLHEAGDPLLGLVACTGSAACARGLADSTHHALHLAELLRANGPQPVAEGLLGYVLPGARMRWPMPSGVRSGRIQARINESRQAQVLATE
ncbi:hypothetical protein, partial [Bowmanella yangjiangensis]